MADTQAEQDQHIQTLIAAVGELTERIVELESTQVVVVEKKVMERRGVVTRVRRGDGRVVQRVTPAP